MGARSCRLWLPGNDCARSRRHLLEHVRPPLLSLSCFIIATEGVVHVRYDYFYRWWVSAIVLIIGLPIIWQIQFGVLSFL